MEENPWRIEGEDEMWVSELDLWLWESWWSWLKSESQWGRRLSWERKERGGWVDRERREMSFRLGLWYIYIHIYIYIYIYIGRFFCNFLFKLIGSGRVWVRAGFLPKLGPISGFKKKTQTQPYSLSNRVKSDPSGSGRAKYSRVGLKLPSLLDLKI